MIHLNIPIFQAMVHSSQGFYYEWWEVHYYEELLPFSQQISIVFNDPHMPNKALSFEESLEKGIPKDGKIEIEGLYLLIHVNIHKIFLEM